VGERVGEWLRDKALSMATLSRVAHNKRMRPNHKASNNYVDNCGMALCCHLPMPLTPTAGQF